MGAPRLWRSRCVLLPRWRLLTTVDCESSSSPASSSPKRSPQFLPGCSRFTAFPDRARRPEAERASMSCYASLATRRADQGAHRTCLLRGSGASVTCCSWGILATDGASYTFSHRPAALSWPSPLPGTSLLACDPQPGPGPSPMGNMPTSRQRSRLLSTSTLSMSTCCASSASASRMTTTSSRGGSSGPATWCGSFLGACTSLRCPASAPGSRAARLFRGRSALRRTRTRCIFSTSRSLRVRGRIRTAGRGQSAFSYAHRSGLLLALLRDSSSCCSSLVSTNQEYYTFPAYFPLLLLTAGSLAAMEQAPPGRRSPRYINARSRWICRLHTCRVC